MAKKDKFPSIVYIVRDEDGYLIVGTNLVAMVGMGQKAEVSSYNLGDIFEVEGKAIIVR